ncbi:MAG: hypothetical protein RLY86_3283 [Pseudomonadota bacterium]|jgi:hypothetical protein
MNNMTQFPYAKATAQQQIDRLRDVYADTMVALEKDYSAQCARIDADDRGEKEARKREARAVIDRTKRDLTTHSIATSLNLGVMKALGG